jgi:hypothetical protein
MFEGHMSFLYLGRKNFFTNRLVEKFCPFFFKKKIWEKYNLAPQTTIGSPDGTSNYQSLDFGPSNYPTVVFWPHPSAWAV